MQESDIQAKWLKTWQLENPGPTAHHTPNMKETSSLQGPWTKDPQLLETLIILSNNLRLKAQFSQGWEKAANPVLARSSQYAPQSWQQIMPSEHYLTLRYFNSHFPCQASVLGTCSRVKKCCLAEPTLHLPGRALGWLRCGVGECKFFPRKLGAQA